MTFITLPGGAIIDLDSVTFVVRAQSKTASNGIKIGVGNSALSLFLDDARRFLEELRDSKGVNVEQLLKWIPVTSKS
jgi:hypothetical protein